MDSSFAPDTHPLPVLNVDNKAAFLIAFVFFIYALLLTPLGNYSLPPDEDVNAGFYSIRKIDPGDDSGYLAYLRSAVIEGDYDFFNEKGFWHFDAVQDTGYTANYWYIGAPLLWAPFFLIGHAMAGLLAAAGYPIIQDGYSFPYFLWTHIGSSLLTLGGLLLCHSCLQRLYKPRVAFWATLTCFLGTCLPYFTFVRNRMSHSGDVFVAFLFLYFFLLAREKPERPLWFCGAWGLLLGFLVDLRYISIVYAVLPAGVLLQHGLRGNPINRSFIWKSLVCGIGGMTLGALPQWSYWLQVHGTFSSLNPITIQVEPTLSGILYSFGQLFANGTRGLLGMEWTWLLGLVGVGVIWKRDRWLGTLLVLVFLGFCAAPVVIVDPATFGQRYLLPALPVMALGLGSLFQVFLENQKFRIAQLMSVCAAGWMYCLIVQYKVVLPHNDPEYLKHAFENLPRLFSDLSWFRPTTLPDLAFQGQVQFQSVLDWVYLVGWPLALGGLTVFSLAAVPRILACLETNPVFLKKMFLSTALLFSALSVWTVWNHPPLNDTDTAGRLRVAAVSRWLKSPAHLQKPMEYLDRAHRRTGDTEEEMLIRGDFIFMQGDWQAASRWYRKAIDLNPRSTARVQLERIHLIIQLSKSNSLEPAPSESINALWQALILLDNKRPDEALIALNQALHLEPDPEFEPGIQEMIRQLLQQKSRLARRNIPLNRVPPVYLTMAGTKVNALRMALPLFDGYI